MQVCLGVNLSLLTPLIRHAAEGAVSQAAQDLIHEWGPLMWLHKEEAFFPSTVDYFLQNTEAGQVAI